MKPDEIHLYDWKRILLGAAPATFLLEVLGRTLILYLVLIAVLRVLGKRMTGQLTILEMAVMITLGGIVSAPMELPDRGILIGILLLVCMLGLQRGMGMLGLASRKFELLSQGDLVPLVKDGLMLTDQLRSAQMSREQMFAALREKHVVHLGQLDRVYLEACGTYSLVRARKARPGLCILPPGDDASDDACDPIDACACRSCGAVSKRREIPCENCGAHDWVRAVC